MNSKLDHQYQIQQTLRFMTIQVARMADHATEVGDGDQILLNDDLRALIDEYGLLAETIGNRLRSALETSEDMPAVRLYDANGKAAS